MATNNNPLSFLSGIFGNTNSAAQQAIAQREMEIAQLERMTDDSGRPIPWAQTLARQLKVENENAKRAVTQDIFESASEPSTPKGMIGSSTAGSGWSMGSYAPTQVVQKELMPQRILPREDEDVLGRGSLFGMTPYRWYS